MLKVCLRPHSSLEVCRNTESFASLALYLLYDRMYVHWSKVRCILHSSVKLAYISYRMWHTANVCICLDLSYLLFTCAVFGCNLMSLFEILFYFFACLQERILNSQYLPSFVFSCRPGLAWTCESYTDPVGVWNG